MESWTRSTLSLELLARRMETLEDTSLDLNCLLTLLEVMEQDLSSRHLCHQLFLPDLWLPSGFLGARKAVNCEPDTSPMSATSAPLCSPPVSAWRRHPRTSSRSTSATPSSAPRCPTSCSRSTATTSRPSTTRPCPADRRSSGSLRRPTTPR